MSSKRDNFVRLAEARVARASEAIRIVGNLSNRSNYSYDEQDVLKIVGALQAELNNLKNQFAVRSGRSSREFKLER